MIQKAIMLRNICVNNGLFWSRAPTSITISDYGGRKQFHIQKRNAVNPIDKTFCAISWFTCENNLNHMIGETLLPLSQTILKRNSTTMIVASEPSWVNKDDCKGTRYADFLLHMNVAQDVLFTHSVYSLRRHEIRPFERDVCCERAHVNKPSRRRLPRFYKSMLNAYNVQCSKTLPAYGVIVQRQASRWIVNIDRVQRRLEEMHGCPFRQLVFETMSLEEQMRVSACSSYFVGVQGQGMEWGHFLGIPSRIYEISYSGWPCLYTPYFKQAGKNATCVVGERLFLSERAKYDNITVPLSAFKNSGKKRGQG